MNKAQLMEYLKVVCDAENAIYACDEAITNLKGRMGIFWKMPEKPREPVLENVTPVKPRLRTEEPVKEIWQDGWGCGTAIVGGLIGFVLMWVFVEATGGETMWPLWFVPLGVIGLPIGAKIWSKRDVTIGRETESERIQRWNEAEIQKAKKETEKLEDAARWKYNLAMEEYEKELKVYNTKANAITNAKEMTLSMLRDMVQENIDRREQIKKELEKIYARNVVYPTFRNMVAINQIYEYLAMGLCDSLEGPTGAYSQYIEDLRTNKICDSIDMLRESMESGIKHILMGQSHVVKELQSVKNNISSLGGQISGSISRLGLRIDSGFAGLDDSLRGMQSELSANRDAISGATLAIQTGMDSSNAVVAGQLDEIKKLTYASAHNEYIALRETNIKNYLLKNPNFL